MPGKRISDLQVIKYKELRGKHSQEVAPAKSGLARWCEGVRVREAARQRPEQAPKAHRLASHDAFTSPQARSVRAMGSLLDLADRANVVAELSVVLDALRERNELPDIEVLRAQFAPRPTLMPFVQVKLPATAVYDILLEAA